MTFEIINPCADTAYSPIGGYRDLFRILDFCPTAQKGNLEWMSDHKGLTKIEKEKQDLEIVLYENNKQMIKNKAEKEVSKKKGKVNHKSCWQFTQMFGQMYIVDYKHCEDKNEVQYVECIVDSFVAQLKKLEEMYQRAKEKAEEVEDMMARNRRFAEFPNR